jgi:hypothetical protein
MANSAKGRSRSKRGRRARRALGEVNIDCPFLDEPGFCARYHVAPRTAQRWRVEGGGPAWVRCGPRRVLYRLADCEAWVASRTYASRAAELSAGEVA